MYLKYDKITETWQKLPQVQQLTSLLNFGDDYRKYIDRLFFEIFSYFSWDKNRNFIDRLRQGNRIDSTREIIVFCLMIFLDPILILVIIMNIIINMIIAVCLTLRARSNEIEGADDWRRGPRDAERLEKCSLRFVVFCIFVILYFCIFLCV